MKFHWGRVKNPVDLVTHATGTIYVDPDGVATHDGVPRDIVRLVKSLYGVSWRRAFIGIMTYEDPR